MNSKSRFLETGKEQSSEEQKSQDVFDLGHILLVAATGGLELLNQEALDFPKEEADCCLMHQLKKYEESKTDCYLKLTDLIGPERFSPDFLDLLCKCLKFDQSRSTPRELLSHPWITGRNEKEREGP